MLVKRPPVPTSRPIIVADDDAGDRLLIQQALEDCGVDADVWFAADGKSLLDELQRRARTAAAPLLVLLDLNMPRMDGREVLRVVKRDPVLMDIPIVVLTNSSNPLDFGANAPPRPRAPARRSRRSDLTWHPWHRQMDLQMPEPGCRRRYLERIPVAEDDTWRRG